LKNYAVISIIGYTNAGKTALMNYLTGENLLSENLLFQTLSTTARRLMLPENEQAALIDTVGFISDLPHELVEAFKATLEGSQNADILLHVRDISHPYSDLQKHTVLTVLEELKIDWKPRYVEAWNKIDLVDGPIDISKIEEADYPIVPISAKHGLNCDKLLDELTGAARRSLGKELIDLFFPLQEYSRRTQWLKEVAGIMSPEYEVHIDKKSNTQLCKM
jgi:GTP-binding protein HflX